MVITFKNTFLLSFWLSVFAFNLLQAQIILGAEQVDHYLPFLQNKNVGVVAHASSLIKNKNSSTHLIDSLLSLKIKIKKVFAPEHGFRSKADNGADISNSIDPKTKLPIISLHGKHKKPQHNDLQDIEIIVFDIQDVGVRFYTYISTLHLVMEACAENNIPLLVLDRPNPNAHYIDGPVMENKFKSFLGMHNVPIVYGLTIGEYAKMINNEGWLNNQVKCNLTVVPLKNYTHKTPYVLPIRPSPNLPNSKSINLYPSLCLLEQTSISIGRGTEMQFQIYGHPDFSDYNFSFTPMPNFGAKYPKLKGELCKGVDLRNYPKVNKIELSWILDAYNKIENKESFFFKRFAYIAGTKKLQKQIKKGKSEKKIKASWKKDLMAFRKIRAKYLLYKD